MKGNICSLGADAKFWQCIPLADFMPEPVEQMTKNRASPLLVGLDPLLHTSFVISETSCQLAHRGVEKLLRWQLKKIIGRVIGITIISDSIVGLYPC